MVKRAPFYLTLLVLAPALSAQTTASGAKTVNNLTASSSSSSANYEATSFATPNTAPADEETSMALSELWVRSYCMGHPGEDWTRTIESATQTGHCPSADDKSTAVLNKFLAHHKKIAPSPVNAQTLVAYVNYNNLDPRKEKSYERAYKSLKSAGQLEIYK